MYFELGAMEFYLPTRIIFGWGKVKELPRFCNPYGKRGLMVTMKDIPHGESILNLLKDAGMHMVLFDECEPEPSVDGIDRAWQTLKEEKFDLIISIGGGSAIDTAKAFRILNTNGGSIWEYTIEMGSEMHPVHHDLIPQIAIPTTAGTGAEVTCIAVVSNKSLKKKAPVVNPRIYPAVALVDPELTLSMPRKVTANTGFDAFTHAYESLFTKQELSPLAHQLCVSGMKMVADNLERAIDNPNDKDLRTILSWAATQNGLLLSAIPTGGGSGVHTFALPFAAILGLVHGESLALAIGPLTQYHIQRKPERGRILSDIFGLDTENLEGIELKEKITESLDLWLGRIGLISKLSDYGVKGDMIDQFVQNVSLPRIKNTFGPDFSTEDIRKIYEAC